MKYIENDEHLRGDQNQSCGKPQERAISGGFIEEEAALALGVVKKSWNFNKCRWWNWI